MSFMASPFWPLWGCLRCGSLVAVAQVVVFSVEIVWIAWFGPRASERAQCEAGECVECSEDDAADLMTMHVPVTMHIPNSSEVTVNAMHQQQMSMLQAVVVPAEDDSTDTPSNVQVLAVPSAVQATSVQAATPVQATTVRLEGFDHDIV